MFLSSVLFVCWASAAAETLVNLIVSGKNQADLAKLESLTLTEEELQWVHVLAEGWATPLKGFMTEEQYLQSTHFEHIIVDGQYVPMPVPIVKTCTTAEKEKLTGKEAITLTYGGKIIAVMKTPSFFEHMKEERAGRTFGITDKGHPYIEMINSGGDWLVGGELEVLEKPIYNDGMDQWRLSPAELQAEFKKLGADAVFAFQLRNPVHNGHALLMQDTARRLKEQGYKKPVLWLSPLGGWTKDDDVPLKTRMDQHHAIIKNGIFGDTPVVLAIFPSPMIYGGPREVQWHAKSRMTAGATHYIVGRDPAGMKHPDGTKDLYHMWHGQTMLKQNPGLAGMKLLPFHFASYDTKAGKMAFFDPKRKEDFKSISGTKMRKMAADGEDPPPGFMDPEGWKILVAYYKSLAGKKEL
jgi:3'-phosphoadenosine 5'-phosphosulfate synthase